MSSCLSSCSTDQILSPDLVPRFSFYSANPIANPQAEYASGSGNIDPVKALNPGLIYEAGITDYSNFLCAAGYSTAQIQIITGENIGCPSVPGSIHDLNYPSFALTTFTSTPIPLTSFRRTVTNVGSPSSTYRAKVTSPTGLIVQVTPEILSFTSVGESQSYTLTISGVTDDITGLASASLVWDNGANQVRSPITVAHVVVT